MNLNQGPLNQFQNAVGKQQDIYPQFKNGRVVNVTEKPVEWFQAFDNNEPNTDFSRQALYPLSQSAVHNMV